MDDILTLIIMVLCGLLFLILGYMIWIKEKIELIHDYHYKKVKEEDKKPYTALMGKAVLIIGIGCLVTGILSLFTEYCMIAFGVSFGISLIIITYAQFKYNHGII